MLNPLRINGIAANETTEIDHNESTIIYYAL